MARRIFDFDDPDRFVTGAVGAPGQRTFFLQAAQGARLASVVLEKMQVALLADRVVALLAELGRRGRLTDPDDEAAGDDERPLDEPLREDFRVGDMAIAWDDGQGLLVIEVRSMSEEEDEEEEEEEDEEEPAWVADDAPEGPDLLRVHLRPTMARGFVERTVRVVGAGRPPCPFCGSPLARTGHLCPRRNGTAYLH